MSIPDADQYVFLVITWGKGGEDEREVYGPYPVREDGSHLNEITERAQAWKAEYPDRPGMTFYLFATALVQRGDNGGYEPTAVSS